MDRFKDHHVLVTGGSSGIGLAAALAFAREGAQVIITGRNPVDLESAARRIGATAWALTNDASDPVQARELARVLGERGVSLSAVFINAGIARFASLEQASEDLWNAIFDTNVKGAYFQLQALLPLLRPGASIVLNGSINARIGMPNSSIYAASKAALITLAKTLSSELLPRGVRVNVVSPGPVTTPIYGKLGLDAEALQEVAASIQRQVPAGRFGEPHEIAATVLHLASPESSFIVGTEIIVDGGMSQL